MVAIASREARGRQTDTTGAMDGIKVHHYIGRARPGLLAPRHLHEAGGVDVPEHLHP
jgi:hypothetical protein